MEGVILLNTDFIKGKKERIYRRPQTFLEKGVFGFQRKDGWA